MNKKDDLIHVKRDGENSDAGPVNVLDGLVVHYYHKGKGPISRQDNYLNGKLEGESQHFDRKGNIKQRMNFSQGQPNGPAEFYVNGRLHMRSSYVNGKMTGESLHMDPASGMPRAAFTYNDGAKHGPATVYGPMGTVQKTMNYDNDQLHGHTATYYPDGKLMMEGNYFHGAKHGQFVNYHKNGKPSQVAMYDGGRLVELPKKYNQKGDEIE